jgi:hypothetical protein
MNKCLLMVVTIAAGLAAACATRVPEPAGLAPGGAAPQVSWVIMRGDRDNPDQEFVCQSNPRNDCVLPASRPDAPVFADVHIYYHAAGSDTKYTGSMQIGFFQASAGESHASQVDTTVRKTESIAKQSIVDDVTEKAGNYSITFDLVATSAETSSTGKTRPIRAEVPVAVK